MRKEDQAPEAPAPESREAQYRLRWDVQREMRLLRIAIDSGHADIIRAREKSLESALASLSRDVRHTGCRLVPFGPGVDTR